MASHRRVKNVDFDNDDLEDYDEEETNAQGDEALSADDEEQMRQGTIAVRERLGHGSSATSKEIQEALWHYYYDIDKSVSYLLKKQAPPEPKKTKQPTRFDQAAQAASAKPKKKIGFGLDEQDWNMAQPYQSPFKSSDFFRDSPWLCVPEHRRGVIIERIGPRSNLLGGSSSSGTGKPSKLAVLAAARKREKQERAKLEQPGSDSPTSGNLSSSVALLDRLDSRKTAATPAPTVIPVHSLHHKTSATEVPPQSISKSTQEEQNTVETNEISSRSPIEPSTGKFTATESMKATPSTFASTVLGGNHDSFTRDSMLDRLSTLKSVLQTKFSDSEGFAGPSPDDKVLEAQSQAAKRNKNSAVKSASNKVAAADVTNDVAALKIDDTPTKAKSKNLDVLAEFEKSKSKDAANFVVIGHVDHGKSTLMGRLLCDLKIVNSRSLEKLQKEASQIGKSSFALAWVMDSTSDERQRGVTVDIATNYFETEKTRFTILDAPGHQDFIPNMIAGASQADFAVLVIDASTNAFESGLRGQTKEHALLARSLGIGRIIVAVNKMDTVFWSEERFLTIQQQMSAFFAKQSFLSKNITFIPCAGLTGENVVKPPIDGTMPWYNGSTLVEELDRIEPAKRAITDPLRLTISEVFRSGAQNALAVSGRIEGGSLQVGDTLLAMPANENATVKAIEVENGTRDWAVAGQIATLHLSDIDPIYLRAGDIICNPNNQPIRNTRSFTAKILAFDHVTPSYVDVHKGRLHTSARVAALVAVLDKQSGEVTKKKPRILKPGDVARVRVELEGAMLPLEAGVRVVFRANGGTVAAGLIEVVQ